MHGRHHVGLSLSSALLLATAAAIYSTSCTTAHAQDKFGDFPNEYTDNQNREIRIRNHSSRTMQEFHASSILNHSTWSRDYFGRTTTLAPNYSIKLTVSDRTSHCRFDFKMVFDDGLVAFARDVNVCESNEYTVENGDLEEPRDGD